LPDSIQIDKVELLPNELYMMVNAEQTFEKDIYKILEELAVIYRRRFWNTLCHGKVHRK
jgi:hypothetical protein